MSTEALIVFSLLGAVAVLMASNRVRLDIIALLTILTLILSGVMTPTEALSGFGSTIVVVVAGLLIVGETLDRTGVANMIGNVILKRGGKSETRLIILIMVGTAILGSVMSSTAVVAIFIPIVLRIARETSMNASRILLPMSYAALISGMLTLIATTPNLVVSGELRESGYAPFGFFSFTILGLSILAIAVVYILFFGRKLLSSEVTSQKDKGKIRSILLMWDDFRVDRRLSQLVVSPSSKLNGRTLRDIDLQNEFGVLLTGIKRQNNGSKWLAADSTTQVLAGDTMIATGKPSDIERMQEKYALFAQPFSKTEAQKRYWEIGAATVMVHSESSLLGHSVRDLEFRSRYGLQVFGLRRGGEALADFEGAVLQTADTLLIIGPWHHIKQLQAANHDFVMLEMPAEKATVIPAYTKMTVALVILTAMVMLNVLGVVPLVASVMMAVLAAVCTRCLTMEDSYRAVPWSSIVLLGGMLPLADALEKTGGTQLVVDLLMSGLGDAGPRTMITILFFLTAGLSLFLSNTASAVLVAPIAISSAEALGISPYPLALAVLIAASASFVSPVSTPVVTLIVEPGRYRFIDFIKVGVPMLILAYIALILIGPLIFPSS